MEGVHKDSRRGLDGGEKRGLTLEEEQGGGYRGAATSREKIKGGLERQVGLEEHGEGRSSAT